MLQEKHRLDLENLTLTSQPFKTLKFFILATVQYLKQSILYILRKGGWFMLLSILVVSFGILLIAVDGPHEKVFNICFASSIWHPVDIMSLLIFGKSSLQR